MTRFHYRTQYQPTDYVFEAVDVGGSWRAYIERQPPYGSRNQGAHETHRLTADGRQYVCWDSPLRTEEECWKIAALWADCTQHYVATGRFEPLPSRDDPRWDISPGTPLVARPLRSGAIRPVAGPRPPTGLLARLRGAIG